MDVMLHVALQCIACWIVPNRSIETSVEAQSITVLPKVMEVLPSNKLMMHYPTSLLLI